TALATVLFPRFAENWQSAWPGEFHKVCTNALRMALFISLPLSCIFFVLRVPFVTLFFQRGTFPVEAGKLAARLFGLLLLAAPASVAYNYLQKMFYAAQEMRVPTYVQLAGALLLTGIAPVTAARFGVDGVAVLLAVLAWLTSGELLLILNRRYGAIRIKELGI